MNEPGQRHLVVWEARHNNGWTTLVIEQPDGTFVAWAGLGEAIGVDYVEDTHEHAQAPAMFALKRKSGPHRARRGVRTSRCGATGPADAVMDRGTVAHCLACSPNTGERL